MSNPPPLILTDLPPPPATLDADIAIVVPPTPTKQLLPLSETDGLTSGAVQPPGSTGEETKHNVVRVTVGEPGDEDTDGSSEDEQFEEGHLVQEWEDDEQRLIREGGAGIPVGPVSQNLPPSCHGPAHRLSPGRDTSAVVACNLAQIYRQEMPCFGFGRNIGSQQSKSKSTAGQMSDADCVCALLSLCLPLTTSYRLRSRITGTTFTSSNGQAWIISYVGWEICTR